ncbi:MAG TPA: hypothetical protein VF506_06985, partial [Streptosporangiaceae bacterium]
WVDALRICKARIGVTRIGVSRVGLAGIGVPVVCVLRPGHSLTGKAGVAREARVAGQAWVACVAWVGRAGWRRGWSRPVARICEPGITGGGRRGRTEPGVGARSRIDDTPVHTPAPVRVRRIRGVPGIGKTGIGEPRISGERPAPERARIGSPPGIAVLVIAMLRVAILRVAMLGIAVLRVAVA